MRGRSAGELFAEHLLARLAHLARGSGDQVLGLHAAWPSSTVSNNEGMASCRSMACR